MQVKNVISQNRFSFSRPEILQLWVKAIRRENWYPSKGSRICSQHFRESDYLFKPGSSRRLLKPDSVPSIFAFPKHLQKKFKKRKILNRIIPHENADVVRIDYINWYFDKCKI